MNVRKIDIWDMFLYIASKWKKILIACVIGAIVLSGVSYYKSYTTTSQNVNNEKDSLDGLNDEETKNVEGAVALKENLDSLKRYYYLSPVMNLSPAEVPKFTLTYYIGTDGETTRDDIRDIKKMYASYVLSDDVCKKIVSEFKDSALSKDDLNLLINVEQPSQYEDTTDVLTVYVRGIDKKMSNEMAQIIEDSISDYTATLSESIKPHTIKLVSQIYSCGYDQKIIDCQNSIRNLYLNTSTKVDEGIDVLTDKEKSAYELQISKDEKAEEPKKIERPTISKKYTLLGAAVGIILVVVYYALCYMYSKKVRTPKDISDLLDTKICGLVEDDKKTSIWNSMRNTATKNVTIDYLAYEVAMICKNQNIDKICIAGSCEIEDDVKLKKLIDIVGGKEINVSVESCVCEDYNALENIVDCGHVILWEYLDKSEFVAVRMLGETCKMQGLNVLGVVVSK